MKFFIPKIDSPVEAENFFNSIKKFAEDTLKWQVDGRRIRKIVCNHKGKSETYEVGQTDSDTGELVVAILASNSYLVCTPNRGCLHGMPLLDAPAKTNAKNGPFIHKPTPSEAQLMSEACWP